MPNPLTDETVYANRNRLVTRNGVETRDSQLLAGLDSQILRVPNVASQEPCIVGPLSAEVLACLYLHCEFANPVVVFSQFVC